MLNPHVPSGARLDDPSLDTTSPQPSYWPRLCAGRVCFTIETAASEQYRLGRIGLTLEEVLAELVEDLRAEADWCAAHGTMPPPEDLVIWREGRAVALVRRRPGEEPAVVVFEDWGG